MRKGDPGGYKAITTPPGKMGNGGYGALVAGPGFGTDAGARGAGSVRVGVFWALALTNTIANNTSWASTVLVRFLPILDKVLSLFPVAPDFSSSLLYASA
jgi:hypothetical protein